MSDTAMKIMYVPSHLYAKVGKYIENQEKQRIREDKKKANELAKAEAERLAKIKRDAGMAEHKQAFLRKMESIIDACVEGDSRPSTFIELNTVEEHTFAIDVIIDHDSTTVSAHDTFYGMRERVRDYHSYSHKQSTWIETAYGALLNRIVKAKRKELNQ